MNEQAEPNLERRALVVSAIASLTVAVVGLWLAVIARSQAVLLDGLFNLIYFVMSLFSLKVARLIQRPDDERFPFGYAHFEPLINATKGLLILGIAVVALIGALSALVTGGREVGAGSALAYGVFATVIGLGTAALEAVWARKTGSPLVAVDVKNWAINGALSAVVALSFGGIFLMRGTRLEWLEPYVDPGLVAVLVLLTIVVPIKMVRGGLLELLNAAPDRETVARVEKALDRATLDLAPRMTVSRVLRVGRTLYALVHLVLDEDSTLRAADLDAARRRIVDRLATELPGLIVDLVFTTDSRWALPSQADEH